MNLKLTLHLCEMIPHNGLKSIFLLMIPKPELNM